MSNYVLRVVIEKIDLDANEAIIDRTPLTDIKINPPKHIIELGLRHQEQINILQSIQDKLLLEQSFFLKPEVTKCEKCNGNLASNGYNTAKFHALFTDHELKLQRKKCSNCKTSVVSSVKSIFGTSIHPDLYRLQCEQGAKHSYRKAEDVLTSMSNTKRDINNHNRIKQVTNQVGEVLSDKNKISEKKEGRESTKSLIIQVDGGHVKTTESNKQSFEIMSAKLYNPENVIEITEKRSAIKEKRCVASAKSDKQSTMKKYVLAAAKQQGLTDATYVTGLADGAKNCWCIIQSLEKHSKNLLCILDWFHIAKKIEPVRKSASVKASKQLVKIKNHLWKGETEQALTMLKELKDSVDSDYKSKINGIYLYINRNKNYIINYNERAQNELPYTSQVAESTVEHLINDRHKRNQKMQWSREGAHNVLQIRASMASNLWEFEWQDAVFEAIKNAA